MTNVIMHTTMGDIKIQMHDDMPITTGNFLKLAKEGFYNGVIFHRVIDGFMIQGGDPQGRKTEPLPSPHVFSTVINVQP